MVVMVQREVAREMAAPPGKMRVLSVATQLYGRPRVVASVPPRAFRPPPKVTSAVVRIDVYPRPLLNLDSVEGFFRLVKAGFSAPRKQLRNCMRLALDVPPERMETAFQQAGVDPTRRAQTVSVPEWGQLYESFQATGHLLQWSP
jgi:16S rRNA (adenine1518-N6/adenine1519-N6)-dimethyltransferase